MKITFLGTSSMLPTSTRNHTAIFLEYKKEGILIDCGEGTQKQFRLAKIKPSKISKILITHFHGDHLLGMPGIIQNLAANQYGKLLEIYGPKGLKKKINNLMSGIEFAGNINFKVTEISSGTFFKNEEFSLKATKLSHGIECLGYSFIESNKRRINLEYTKKFGLIKDPILGKLQKGKTITFNGNKITPKEGTILVPGKKVTFILDTKFCSQAVTLAKNSDVLISESTWLTDTKEKKGQHLTATEAALLAKKSNSKKLILTHFSQRYKNHKDFEKEAKKTFNNSIAAEDLISFSV